MFRNVLRGCVAGACLVIFSGAGFADDIRLEQKLEEIKSRLDVLEQKRCDNAVKAEGLLNDLVIGGGITLILQNANNANAAETDLYNGSTPTVGSYSLDLGFEKLFDENNKVFVHLESGQGSIESQLQVFSNVNRDSDESDAVISVTEAWYMHNFSSIGLNFTVGKIDASAGVDENAYANDETSQFLGNLFRNSAAIDMPDDNSFGMKTAYESSKIDATLQYMSADASFGDVTRNIFISAQVNLKPDFIGEKEGNYRFYAWTNTKEYSKWTDLSKTDEKNYGFGISFDQQLTDILGAFARYGWQDQSVYNVEQGFSLSQSWSFGLQFMPGLFNENDVFGVAYGQIIPSSDYKDVNVLNAKTENHFEIYYNWSLNDYLSVSPDAQIIENPYGGDAENGDDTIFVCGIRVQINF